MPTQDAETGSPDRIHFSADRSTAAANGRFKVWTMAEASVVCVGFNAAMPVNHAMA